MDLRAMAMAHVTAGALHAAVELGLPQQLAGGPCSPAQLAGRTGSDPAALGRLLRFLTAHGVVSELADGQIALTAEGALLARDEGVAGAVRALARPGMWEATGRLADSVRAGAPVLARGDRPLYDRVDADEAQYFSDTMIGFHGHEVAGVLAAYDFSDRRCVVDVGGSTGNLLATLLAAYPELHGVLFDLPSVVECAAARLERAGVADRCTTVGGSFFDSVPTTGDTYLLSHVLHDWNDADASRILAAVRGAMTAGDELLIAEEFAGLQAASAATLDLILLVTSHGRSREPHELAALLDAAGLRLERVVPATDLVDVVVAVVA